MRKNLALLITILLAICLTGCNQSIAATEASATEKTVQTPAPTLQQTATPSAAMSQPEALPSPVTVDLSYTDTNKYPGMNCTDMVEDNLNVYYCSNAGISKQNKETGEAKIIYRDEPLPNGTGPYCLTIYQDRMFFIQDKTIRSIDINGDGLKVLFDWDKYVAQNKSQKLQKFDSNGVVISTLCIKNGLLYFQASITNTESEVFEYNPATGNSSILINNALGLNFSDNYVYYTSLDSNEDEVYRMNLATKEKELVAGADMIINNGNNSGFFINNNFVSANDQLFFTGSLPNQPYNLYKYDNNGSIKNLYSFEDNTTGIILNEYAGNIYVVCFFYIQNSNYQKSVLYKLDPKTDKCMPISLMQFGSGGISIINNTFIYPSPDFNKEGDPIMRYIDLSNFG